MSSQRFVQVNPGRYRVALPGEVVEPPSAVIALPCVHLGQPTGERVGCGSCSSRTDLKVFTCARHTRCTIARQVPDMACCATCPDRRERDFVKHLIYHIYPRKGSNWRWNVEQLLRRIDLFDGRRIVAIVTDHTTDTASIVRQSLASGRCEFIHLSNDPRLGEVATHQAMYEAIADLTGPEHVTLRAHAKGVSNHTWADGGAIIRLWTETLYETLLDYWPVVAGVLRRHPLAGSLLRRGYYFEHSLSPWHYSGSWYWFRNKDMFSKSWREIDHRPHGVETFPSLHFQEPEAGIIFGDLPFGKPASYPYLATVWEKTIIPELVAWRAENSVHRRAQVVPGLSLSIIVPTTGRPSLSRTLASVTSQLLPGDQLIVLRDDSGDWGATPRKDGMGMATGDYLLFLDDDDEYLPGALAMVRAALAQNPRRPHLFRMRRGHPANDTLPGKRVLEQGQVSTQMFVVPNALNLLGRWGSSYAGDWDFISSTLALYPAGSLVWRDEVICCWRP